MATNNALLDSLGLIQAATDTSNATDQTGQGEFGAAIFMIFLMSSLVLFSWLAEKQRNKVR